MRFNSAKYFPHFFVADLIIYSLIVWLIWINV